MSPLTTSIQPRVTIVMPSYNAAKTIGQSIESIQLQTFVAWELIVVDDGSKDGSTRIVRGHAERDSRIRLLSQANAGPAVARNNGVAAARADIVAFLDSDDIWQPDHLTLAIEMLDASARLGVAFAPCEHLTPTAAPTGQTTRAWCSGVNAGDILACNPTATCSSLVVRKAVFETAGLMRADMVHAEDQEWLFRVAHAGWEIRSHATPTVGYRASPRGLSSNVERMYAGWLTFLDHARALDPRLVERAYPSAATSMHLYYARRLLRDGAYGLRPLRHVLQAVALSPIDALRKPITVFGAAALAVVGSVSPNVAAGLFSKAGKLKHA
jgi:glycosyltransferase involved in cell wall biosynthesis